ncbi:unnamed protein product [Linum trigynum]|uniref:Uncharacterized protein n=1 Tax=Linum trigynum TaxID=586398 RepID=A0AAV2G7B2_9ROSI
MKRFQLEQHLVVEAAMLQLHCGLPINSVAVLPPRKSSRNGVERLVRTFLSSSLMEQPIVLVVVRLLKIWLHLLLLDIPMVLVKPPEACPTGEVYKHLRVDQASQVDPLTLLEMYQGMAYHKMFA